MKTTVIRHPLKGFLLSAMVMTLFYIVFWLIDIGGMKGMYDDDSYPVSMVFVPMIGALVSSIIFLILVLPSVLISRWLVRKERFPEQKARMIVLWVSILIGGFSGLLTSDAVGMFASAIYVGCGAIVFWITAVRDRVETDGS